MQNTLSLYPLDVLDYMMRLISLQTCTAYRKLHHADTYAFMSNAFVTYYSDETTLEMSQ